MSPPARTNSKFKQLDTAVRVETPERIAFEYQVVGPFRRLMAYGLDILIVGLAFIGCCLAIVLSFLLVAWLVPQINGDIFGQWMASSFGVIAIIAALTFWFYGAVCEAVRNGQTFGKQIANIRVLSTDGSAIDGVQAMVRNLFRFLDIMPLMPPTIFFVFDSYEDAYGLPLFLTGLTCMVLTKKFQRIGDLVAGTMVVLVERDWAPELASFSDPRVAKLAELIPNDFIVSPAMAKALAAFAEAIPRLGPDHSGEIAARMATPLKRKLDFPSDLDPTLILCALYFKTFSRFNSEEDPLSVGTASVPSRLKTDLYASTPAIEATLPIEVASPVIPEFTTRPPSEDRQ
jgi:uncharacterized RDD family membrane protein YckC